MEKKQSRIGAQEKGLSRPEELLANRRRLMHKNVLRAWSYDPDRKLMVRKKTLSQTILEKSI